MQNPDLNLNPSLNLKPKSAQANQLIALNELARLARSFESPRESVRLNFARQVPTYFMATFLRQPSAFVVVVVVVDIVAFVVVVTASRYY